MRYNFLSLRGFMRSAFISFVLLASISATSAATSSVGATHGSFAVSPTGAATYTIPIAVPPGTAGMEPKLALSYNSQGGNGLLGMGWSLSGLSAITRCPQTVAQDGVKGGVNFDVNDRFCLDGQRLVATTGAYGANNTEYRTEIESFSRIISYGTVGSGPAWFKVWTKSGQILEFGNSISSSVQAQGKSSVAVWAVNKISDTVGNYLTVTYTNNGNASGEYYPTRIDYTGNATTGALTYNSVQLTPVTRTTDITPLYQAGSMIKNTVLFSNIKTYSGTTMVRDYQLQYETGTATKRSRLKSLTECAGDGICLAASKFIWQESDNSYSQKLFTNNISPQGSDGWDLYMADVNGDGKSDLVFKYPSTNQLQVLLSNGDGTFTQALFTNNISPQGSSGWSLYMADVNGDGKSDLVFKYPSTNQLQSFCVEQNYPDILLSITSGLTATTSLTYKPLTDNSVYTKGAGAVYPVMDLQAPIYVVSHATSSNGVGGSFNTDYTYGGAKVDQSGRGFLGFAWEQALNTGNNITGYTEYAQSFPYIGMPTKATTKLGASQVLKQTTNTLATFGPQQYTGVYFPYISQSVETANDLNGAVLPTVTTTTQYDTYGNPTNITVSTWDGYSKSTVNTYFSPTIDATHWFLGRLQRSTVSSTIPCVLCI